MASRHPLFSPAIVASAWTQTSWKKESSALLTSPQTHQSKIWVLQQGGNLWLFATERFFGEIIIFFLAMPLLIRAGPPALRCLLAQGVTLDTNCIKKGPHVLRARVYRQPRQPPWAPSSPPGTGNTLFFSGNTTPRLG